MATSWFVSRKGWNARPPRKPLTAFKPAEVKGMAVHHTVTTPPASHGSCASAVRKLQTDAFAEGYADIEYNRLVCPHGYVFEGRGDKVRSGANGTNYSNRAYVAVVVIGKNPDPEKNPLIDAGLQRARRGILKNYPNAKLLRPHSSFKATACPGNPLRAWIAEQ